MAIVNLSPIFNWQNLDVSLLLLADGTLETFAAGSSTPLETYTTSVGDVQNPVVIQLDSDGRPPDMIWLIKGSAYKFVLKDSLGNPVGITFDNIVGVNDFTNVPTLPSLGGYATIPTANGGGTGDAITATFSPAITPVDKLTVIVKVTSANTTSVVFNANGTGDKAVVKGSNTALLAGDIPGADYYAIMTFNGSLDKWVLDNPYPQPDTGSTLIKNYISGLEMSYVSAKVIDISDGLSADSTNTQYLSASTIFEKKIDASWAEGGSVGVPIGGFPTGISLTNDTWYSVWQIGKTNGAVDYGWDDLAAGLANDPTNLLADATGYTLFRRIGYIRYGTATIVEFFQHGDDFIWDAVSLDANAISPSTSGASLTLLVPPNTIARFSALFINNGAGGISYIVFSETAITNSVPSATNADALNRAGGDDGGGMFFYQADSSSQIRQRSTSALTQLTVMTKGWTDLRGQH